MDDVIASDSAPTSFGAFKPVGSVMVGLPSQAEADALRAALQQAGWAPADISRFEPGQAVEELESMIQNAGPLAGFGYELTLLRRYLALSRQGTLWMLVQVADDEAALKAAALARAASATLAVHYKTLTVEELI
jgi:hypothetical protein